MSYDQHDLFRDRLNALPLSAGRRGLAAMVLVEIVRWMPGDNSHCTKTGEELGALLNLRPGDVLSALGTLQSLGAIEQTRQDGATLISLRPMLPTKSPEERRQEITEAIQCHTAWKRRLRLAIDSGKSDTTIEEVSRPDLCEFGRWLHGPSFGEADRDGNWEVIGQLHAQFHRVAAATLQLALSGRKADAEQAMSVSGVYARASLRLSRALTGWRGARTP